MSTDASNCLLLDIDGLLVERAVRDASGPAVAHCSTDPELADWFPYCGEQSSQPKAWGDPAAGCPAW
jgi:hypothetical protein